jgi:hypothetical protein
MWSQTRLTASDEGISFSPVPKKLARASDKIIGSWLTSVSAGEMGSLSTGFNFFESRFESFFASSGLICLAKSLFILNISVLSVSKTRRSSSLQIIFLLLFGSCKLFLRMYAQSCLTISVLAMVGSPTIACSSGETPQTLFSPPGPPLLFTPVLALVRKHDQGKKKGSMNRPSSKIC